MSNVLSFPARSARPNRATNPAPQPAPRWGDPPEIYLVEAEAGGWVVVEMAANGNSACYHHHCDERADAMDAGRAVARRLGARFLDDEPTGGAA